MHELAICQSLINQVEDIAHSKNKQKVNSIVLGMGPLSGVEIALLKNAYSVACAGTVAEGAQLIVENLPLIVKCTQCEKESEVLPNKLTCQHCGDWRTTLISGDEMMLMSLVLDDAEGSDIQDSDNSSLSDHLH